MTLPNWNLKKFYDSVDDNKISKDLKEYINHANDCCGEFAYIFEPNNEWVCYAVDYWNPVTKDFNDTFEIVKKEIPSDYPSDIAA